MAATLLARCPGCKRDVRLAEDWATKTVKCKQCGMICQAKPSAALLARQAAAKKAPPVPTPSPVPMPVAAPMQQPVAQPMYASPQPAMYAAAQPTMFQATPPSVGFPTEASAWNVVGAEAFGDPGADAVVPKYKRKGRSWLTVLLTFAFLLLCLGGSIAAVIVLGPRIKAKLGEQQANNSTEKGTNPANPVEGTKPAGGPAVAAATGGFPRRMLAISINSYVYANPTSYGTDAAGGVKRDFGETMWKIANKMRIPDNQVFELSDSARQRAKPPLKPIVEQTLTRFLETSRAQDRLMIVLCAHTVEVDGKPYLVPLEGDLDDVKTLVPLAWIMEQIEKCPAQQKLVIADFNRFDRARGKERPTGGKLAASTEALLKNPPKGVQVWSACSAGQYSYEFDDTAEFNGQAIKGGAFLSMFSVAFRDGLGGIQKPEDPFPLDKLIKRVNADTVEFSVGLDAGDEPAAEETKPEKKADAKEEEKKPEGDNKEKMPAKKAPRAAQTPFFAGEPSPSAVTYNPDEPVAKPFSIPSPEDVFTQGIVRWEEIEKLMGEISLPSLKPTKSTDTQVKFERVFPFTADVMKDYKDAMTFEEVKKEREKYPLRAAVVDAVEQLRALNESGTDLALPTTITEGDRTDAQKNNLARMQRGPARVLQKLEEIMEMLQKQVDDRKEEKSKRWQAHFDYILAQVKSRYVYVHEYTSAVGLIRKDTLPELDKKKGQMGWKLASTERLLSGTEVKDMLKDAKKLYAKLIKENPKTPWEVLAKRERLMAVGLQWEPYGSSDKNDRNEMTMNAP